MSEGSIGTNGRCESYGKYPPSYTQGNQVCIPPGTVITTCGALFTASGTNLYILIIQDDGNLGFYYSSSITPYLNGYEFEHSGLSVWSDYSVTRAPVNTTFTYATDGDISVSGGYSWSLGTYGTNGLFCVDSVSGTVTLYNAGPTSLTNPVWEVTCSTTSCTTAFVLSGYPSTASSPGPSAVLPTTIASAVASSVVAVTTTSSTTLAATSASAVITAATNSDTAGVSSSNSSGDNINSISKTGNISNNSSNISGSISNTSSTNVPVIVGSVCGVIAVLGIFAFAYFVYARKYKKQEYDRENINTKALPVTPEAAPIASFATATTPSSSYFSNTGRIPDSLHSDKPRATTSFFDDINNFQQQQPHHDSSDGSSTKEHRKPSLALKFEVLDMSRVHEWDPDKAAIWIFRNGGGEVGFAKAKEERITGYSLLTEKVDDIMNVIPTKKFGDKAILRQALVDLQNTVSLPAYS
ncbi:hypothetical protein HK100_002520 [Physocladia obscura]|uniref:Uncharacterized protein n=1 Tax=Physocladia obscura TaxID=109957 RepID=A0AAD5T849_9FUNG|nr:hypothetical protein HK100_002520 [Physocladia obscura]